MAAGRTLCLDLMIVRNATKTSLAVCDDAIAPPGKRRSQLNRQAQARRDHE